MINGSIKNGGIKNEITARAVHFSFLVRDVCVSWHCVSILVMQCNDNLLVSINYSFVWLNASWKCESCVFKWKDDEALKCTALFINIYLFLGDKK